jgi:hypothetical protein
VGTLVDKYLGDIYPEYDLVREILVRQARDLLVCQYLGHVANFEKNFLQPASEEARRLLEQVILISFFSMGIFPSRVFFRKDVKRRHLLDDEWIDAYK